MLNFERKLPVLALAIANEPAEQWLIGELDGHFETINTYAKTPTDLQNIDADVILIAFKSGDIGLDNFAEVMQTSVGTQADVIAILGPLDEQKQVFMQLSQNLGITRLITSEPDEEIDGEDVLNALISYADEWNERKRAYQQGQKPKSTVRSGVPLFGRKEKTKSYGKIIGVSSARGSGGTMVAWNLATALAKMREEVVLLTAADSPALKHWLKFNETRSQVLKQSDTQDHYGVYIGVSEYAMTDDEWAQAARLSDTVRVIVDLSGMDNPPIERVETLIHVRDCDPSRAWQPDHANVKVVLNRIPDGLPISAEDVLGHRPDLTIMDYFSQFQSMWTGRPLVLEHPDLLEGLTALLSHSSQRNSHRVNQEEETAWPQSRQFSLS